MKKKLEEINVTVQLEAFYWLTRFERKLNDQTIIAQHVFIKKPKDNDLYEYISHFFYELKFSERPDNIKLLIKRKTNKKELSDHLPKSKIIMSFAKLNKTQRMKRIQDPYRIQINQANRLSKRRNKFQ